jgi:hypothetical protein
VATASRAQNAVTRIDVIRNGRIPSWRK